MANPSAARQFLTSITGGPVQVPGYFATFSGAGVESDTTQSWEGGQAAPDVIGGPPTTADIEVSRSYDILRDQPIIDALYKHVGSSKFTISQQPCTADFQPVGKATTYPGSLLKAISIPESDASSGDPATYTLTLTPSRPA